MRGYHVDVGVVLTEEMKDGERRHKQREIDFVVNLGRSKVYIQCAYAIESQAKRDQETASIERSGDSFRKIVVVATPQPRLVDERGILYVGIMDLLLDPAAWHAVLQDEPRSPSSPSTNATASSRGGSGCKKRRRDCLNRVTAEEHVPSVREITPVPARL